MNANFFNADRQRLFLQIAGALTALNACFAIFNITCALSYHQKLPLQEPEQHSVSGSLSLICSEWCQRQGSDVQDFYINESPYYGRFSCQCRMEKP